MLAKVPEEQKSPIQSMEKPISLADLRLVTTYEERDVIVKEVKPYYVKTKDEYGRTKREMRRKIFGTDIDLEWPETEPEKFEEHPSDTPADKVQERTFVPTMDACPIVPSVIDELRNKFGKFRTRHTPLYIAQKEAELKRKESLKVLKTPMQMRAEATSAKKKVPVLSEEMLEKIGKIVAKNNGLEFEKSDRYRGLPMEIKKAAEKAAEKKIRNSSEPGPETAQADVEDFEPVEGGKQPNVL